MLKNELEKRFAALHPLSKDGEDYFFIAKHRDKQELKEKALSFLENIPPEKNSIIFNWKEFNVELKSAWNTQSLIEQKNNYCNKLLCLKCGIGNQIIKSATK